MVLDWDDIKADAIRFVSDVESLYPDDLRAPLSDACFTFTEMSLWGALGDADIKPDDAIRIWALVETIRQKRGFPKDLTLK